MSPSEQNSKLMAASNVQKQVKIKAQFQAEKQNSLDVFENTQQVELAPKMPEPTSNTDFDKSQMNMTAQTPAMGLVSEYTFAKKQSLQQQKLLHSAKPSQGQELSGQQDKSQTQFTLKALESKIEQIMTNKIQQFEVSQKQIHNMGQHIQINAALAPQFPSKDPYSSAYFTLVPKQIPRKKSDVSNTKSSQQLGQSTRYEDLSEDAPYNLEQSLVKPSTSRGFSQAHNVDEAMQIYNNNLQKLHSQINNKQMQQQKDLLNNTMSKHRNLVQSKTQLPNKHFHSQKKFSIPQNSSIQIQQQNTIIDYEKLPVPQNGKISRFNSNVRLPSWHKQQSLGNLSVDHSNKKAVVDQNSMKKQMTTKQILDTNSINQLSIKQQSPDVTRNQPLNQSRYSQQSGSAKFQMEQPIVPDSQQRQTQHKNTHYDTQNKDIINKLQIKPVSAVSLTENQQQRSANKLVSKATPSKLKSFQIKPLLQQTDSTEPMTEENSRALYATESSNQNDSVNIQNSSHKFQLNPRKNALEQQQNQYGFAIIKCNQPSVSSKRAESNLSTLQTDSLPQILQENGPNALRKQTQSTLNEGQDSSYNSKIYRNDQSNHKEGSQTNFNGITSQNYQPYQARSYSSQLLHTPDKIKANTEKKLPRLSHRLESQQATGNTRGAQFKDKKTEMQYINMQAGLLYERVQKQKMDERTQRVQQQSQIEQQLLMK